MTDYGRHKYQQEKSAREAQKKRPAHALKELRLTCGISEHDYQIKLRSAQGFLLEGDQVQLQILLVDSDVEQDALAVALLNRFATDLGELAVWSEDPKLEKKRTEKLVTLIISPGSKR
ncbi:translation initiation factor IF-3 [bacterium]|nr:translation initiation factor IF-3 [bacterium]